MKQSTKDSIVGLSIIFGFISLIIICIVGASSEKRSNDAQWRRLTKRFPVGSVVTWKANTNITGIVIGNDTEDVKVRFLRENQGNHISANASLLFSSSTDTGMFENKWLNANELSIKP